MEGAAQSLVANVRQALGDEYRLLSGVGGEVTELRDDLATMNALLRMQSEADEGAMDHFDQEWMKQLRELAYDAEDSVDLYKLRVKCRHGDGMAALWFKMVHLARTLTQRHRLAGEIRDLRARTITISERHARYNIDRKALRSSATFAPVVGLRSMPELRRDKSPDHNNQFIDIGDQAGAFAKRLKEDEHDFKVFAVVGFGGVGKTTLAMEVCQRLAADFPYQAMVSVSQTFQPDRDLEKLLKGILQQVVTPKMDDGKGVKEEKDVGISELGAYLSDKRYVHCPKCDCVNFNFSIAELTIKTFQLNRYLIVIDDVWTTQAWEAIEYKLVAAQTNNNCGGRIIVTTRIEAVAEACSTFSTVSGRYIHHMEPLKLEDSKKLFLSKAFGKMDATYPEELKEEMDKILTKCSGIPLAIVSVANILAGYTSKDKWERVCKSMGSEMVAHPSLEGMRHIVGLSYNHLPHELKRCMMYLSIFPEDYEIKKDRLVSRWIAEGLVLEKRGCTLTEVAETYLDELVSRNMVVRRFDEIFRNVEWYRVHDVLLEVMVSKSLESNFVSLLGEQYAGVSYDDRIRRLSIQGSSSSLGIEHGMEVKHVRSLSMFQLQEGHKLLDNLDKFVLLRVLDLEGCKGVTDQHVLHACKLYLLRFLSFKGTEISKVPPQVKKLEHLQVLNFQGTSIGDGGLSDNVTTLKKLERLLCDGWVLPKGIGKMKALRELDAVRLEDGVEIAQELGELEQLEAITIDVGVSVSKEVRQALAPSLSKMYSLRRCWIFSDDKNLEFLHDLRTPPRRLQEFRIGGRVGPCLPAWIGQLTHLVRFTMWCARLSGDQLLGVLFKLPCLKRIDMDVVCCVDRELVARTNYRFPSLVSLDVSAGWIEEPEEFRFEQGSMPELERFAIDFYERQDQVSIVGMEHLTNLKEVRLTGNKSSPALEHALQQVKAEKSKREESHQFQIVVKYWG
ncbi:hypothetical protein HU200_043431 [Digitaria exilis]|uniref:Uncharacterized protein n=1 Tax=Digitaria exilis TaxID=1010633 RepID=A0A835EGA2_9POAL|nr:hypothetical protein HU200_043431 [Digitaria exilis]